MRSRFDRSAPVTDIDILGTDRGAEQKYVEQLLDMGIQIIIGEVKKAGRARKKGNPSRRRVVNL
jgi:hypothetical protein